jgi:3-deoxy-7-phosphoheptulonate synthase
VNHRTDDLRIRDIRELITPEELMREHAVTAQAGATVSHARQAMHRILHGLDDRLAVVMGPCSIHDVAAAMEYARRLAQQRDCISRSLAPPSDGRA